jgi:ribosomal protein S14
MYPELLARIVARGHSSNRRLRHAGKLTDRCDHCGSRMERLGFRCWIEHDRPREQYGTADRLTEAIGGSPRTVLKTLYLPTRKEAREWAYEEAKISKQAVASQP